MFKAIWWKVRTNLRRELVPLVGQYLDSKEEADEVFSGAASLLSVPGQYVTIYKKKVVGTRTDVYPYRTWTVDGNGKILKFSGRSSRPVEVAKTLYAEQRELRKYFRLKREFIDLLGPAEAIVGHPILFKLWRLGCEDPIANLKAIIDGGKLEADRLKREGIIEDLEIVEGWYPGPRVRAFFGPSTYWKDAPHPLEG